MADKTTAMRDFLNTRYSTTNKDLAPLIQRYMAENPNARIERTKVFLEIVANA